MDTVLIKRKNIPPDLLDCFEQACCGECYMCKVLAITQELHRVLKKTGTMWWNHGDNYGSGIQKERRMDSGGDEVYNRLRKRNLGINFSPIISIPEKSLLLQAHRLAIRMIDEQGWILRNICIWHKPNCMPSSVEDRFSVDYEPIFFFTKSQKYFFEQQYESISESTIGRSPVDFGGQKGRKYQPQKGDPNYRGGNEQWGRTYDYQKASVLGRNKRCVWTIPTQLFPDAHFAVYPSELCEIPIKAGCPEYVCTKCGKARENICDVDYVPEGGRGQNEKYIDRKVEKFAFSFQKMRLGRARKVESNWRHTDCGCNARWQPGVVLDPFFGSGTTAIAASVLGRSWVGIELSEEYIQIAKRRLMQHGIYPTSTEKFCL